MAKSRGKLRLRGGAAIAVLLIMEWEVFAEPAPAVVTIDPLTRRELGSESRLDRAKYFTLHADYPAEELTPEDLDLLVNELKVGFGRVFNGPFWHFDAADAPYPSMAQARALSRAYVDRTTKHPLYPYRTTRRIVTDHPADAFAMNRDPEIAADWAVSFFEYFFDDRDRPEFYEPMNEPFIHAGRFGDDEGAVRRRMAEWFREIGKAMDERGVPVKVIGYASAWPSMELSDFKHWNERMKMFMDVAGEYMDGFSVHLYDGTNVTGQDNRRSGSNAEAILDLIESYSFIKWGRVKPHALTEYGDIVKGFPESYSDAKSSQELRAINHLLFSFLDRQDRISISIPFITAKSRWYYRESASYQPYSADLWRPDPTQIEKGSVKRFIPTRKMDFYRLWADVAGERVVAFSDDPDIRVHAFVDNATMHLCLNNHRDHERSVVLTGPSTPGPISTMHIRRLSIPYRESSRFSERALDRLPEQLTLQPHEVVILQLTYAKPVEFKSHVRAVTSYSTTYLQPIEADTPIAFDFHSVPTGAGRAYLRMSLGRKHDRSKAPEVEVNGHSVSVPKNWMGYDQANRQDFFGAIEIPVPMDAIGEHTAVILRFPDRGGHVSSLVLVTETPPDT